MGLRLLERERRVLQGLDDPQPQFEGHEYLLERYLKPRARFDMIESLRKEGVVPTSMIDITDGLASEVLQICKASKCGARIYLDHIPIAKQTMTLAEEMNMDPVVAALNGGEDYELLLTVDPERFVDVAEALRTATGTPLTAIGRITKGNELVWLDNGVPAEIELKGFVHF